MEKKTRDCRRLLSAAKLLKFSRSVVVRPVRRRTAEAERFRCGSSSLYFQEPVNRNKAYAEYFGDYFTLSKTAPGTYRALLADREDEYVYEKGRLVKVIKHNKVKNFIVRLLD